MLFWNCGDIVFIEGNVWVFGCILEVKLIKRDGFVKFSRNLWSFCFVVVVRVMVMGFYIEEELNFCRKVIIIYGIELCLFLGYVVKNEI